MCPRAQAVTSGLKTLRGRRYEITELFINLVGLDPIYWVLICLVRADDGD